MARLLALPLAALALHAQIQPLPPPLRAELKAHFWQPGCPVPLSGLRVLTVTHWGFDKQAHTGQLVVNARGAPALARVFRRLYELRFPIRHMQLSDAYGPRGAGPPTATSADRSSAARRSPLPARAARAPEAGRSMPTARPST